MRRAVLLALALLATATSASSNLSAFGADAGPGKMQHIAVKIVEPKQMAVAGHDKARDYYIVGSKLAKMEETANPKSKRQMLLLVKDADVWEIDEKSKKAVHVTQSNKDGHFPIFEKGPDPESADVVAKLTFGNELEFFKGHSAKKTTGKFEGAAVDEYTLPVKNIVLILDADPKTGTPKRVALKMKDMTLGLKYDKYETVPLNAKLFDVPAGLEVKSVTALELEKKRIEMRKALANRLEEMRQQTLKQLQSEQKTEKELQAKQGDKAKPAAKPASK
jgi:hypothetical protein